MSNTVKCAYCQKELKPQANGLIRRHKTDRKAPKVKEFIGTSFWWGSCIGAGKPQGLDGLLMVLEDVKNAENERQYKVARSYIEMESLKRIREEEARHIERIYKHINKMIKAEFEAITKHKAFQ